MDLESVIVGAIGSSPERVRADLLYDRSPDLRRRRWIVGTSLAGMASMAAVSLLQTGVIRHLPDPPISSFQSDKVNLGRTAYQFGAPDGTFALASLAANLPLAALGGADRSKRKPWISLLAAGKAAVDAAAGMWYFVQMPTKEKAWCGYCILGAAANLAILALTLPEARRAFSAGKT